PEEPERRRQHEERREWVGSSRDVRHRFGVDRMDREEERSHERGERVAEDDTAEPVEEDGRAGVEQRVRQMEAPRPKAPELVVDEVREGLQGAVVAAPDPLWEERVGEDPRDVP